MCNHEEDFWCDNYNLKCELETLANSQTTTDQHGNQYISLNRVQAIINKLECKDV